MHRFSSPHLRRESSWLPAAALLPAAAVTELLSPPFAKQMIAGQSAIQWSSSTIRGALVRIPILWLQLLNMALHCLCRGKECCWEVTGGGRRLSLTAVAPSGSCQMIAARLPPFPSSKKAGCQWAKSLIGRTGVWGRKGLALYCPLAGDNDFESSSHMTVHVCTPPQLYY